MKHDSDWSRVILIPENEYEVELLKKLWETLSDESKAYRDETQLYNWPLKFWKQDKEDSNIEFVADI